LFSYIHCCALLCTLKKHTKQNKNKKRSKLTPTTRPHHHFQQYANFDLPFDINNLAVANSVLMGGIELLRNSETDVEKRLYPGGAFDPLGLASGENADRLKEAEIKHCRLAMVACLGFGAAYLATGKGAFAALEAFEASF